MFYSSKRSSLNIFLPVGNLVPELVRSSHEESLRKLLSASACTLVSELSRTSGWSPDCTTALEPSE